LSKYLYKGSETINVAKVVERANHLISTSLRITNINTTPKSGRKVIRVSTG